MLKRCQFILNAVYAVFGVILLSEGVLYYLYIYMFTSMRNSDHYLLDHNLHWPQIIPWIYTFIGILVILVSFFGCCSVYKYRVFTIIQAYLSPITEVASVATAVFTLVSADTEETKRFLKEALYDAFSEMKMNKIVLESFGNIEVMLRCCAVENPTEYKKFFTRFPTACCGFEDCDFSAKAANERYGCALVASAYSSLALKVMAASAVLSAILGLVVLTLGLLGLKKGQQIRMPQSNGETVRCS